MSSSDIQSKKPRLKKYLLSFVFILGLQFIILLLVLKYIFFLQEEDHVRLQSSLFKNAIELTHDKMDSKAKDIFSMVVNNKRTTYLMSQALHATDETQQEQVRKELFALLTKEYSILKTNGLRQLHFHLPNSISFLRFHKPDEYGDSLQGVRLTIDKVNETKKEISGFEEGRIVNGFRNVFPLFYNNEFVGTVEISYSFAKIKDLLEDLYTIHTQLYLLKATSDTVVFTHHLTSYKLANISPDYYIDTKAHAYKQSHFPKELIEKLEAMLTNKLDSKLSDHKDFSILLFVDAKYYLLFFSELKNFEGLHAGYTAIYAEDPEMLQHEDLFYKFLFLGFCLILLATSIIFTLIYRLRLKESLYYYESRTDSLTRIFNRLTLDNTLEHSIYQANRYNMPLSLIFFDIDHFKHINDIYGHKRGDDVLIHLCRTVEQRLRQTDTFGRWGGEEFLILMPNTTLKQAFQAAESFRALIEKSPVDEISITCSFGVVEYKNNETFEELVNRVDQKLYSAKENGRNKVFS